MGARCCRLRRCCCCCCCCRCATMLSFTSTSCSSAALHSYSGRIVFAEHSPSAAAEWPVTLFALLPFFALPFLPLRCAGGRDMNGGFFRRGVVVPIGKVELQRSMIEVYTLHSTLYTLKLPAKQPTPPHRRMLPAVAHVKNIRRG